MTPPVVRLAAAEAEAAAARLRLNASIAELQRRLDPRLLASAAAEQSRQVRAAGLDTARRNPGAVAGAAVIALAFVLRRPLRRLLRPRPRVYAAAKPPAST